MGCSAKWERSQNGGSSQVPIKKLGSSSIPSLYFGKYKVYLLHWRIWSMVSTEALLSPFTVTAVNRSDSQAQGLCDQQLCIFVSCNTAEHPRFIYLNSTYPRAFVPNKTSWFYYCGVFFASNQPLLLAQKIHWRNKQQNNFHSLLLKILIKRHLIKYEFISNLLAHQVKSKHRYQHLKIWIKISK